MFRFSSQKGITRYKELANEKGITRNKDLANGAGKSSFSALLVFKSVQ